MLSLLQIELIHVACFLAPLDVTGNGYLCGVIFAVKNIQIFILYIVFACNKKKLTYGKGAIEYASPVLVINQMCLLNVNVVVVNFTIQIGQKFYTKLVKAISILKSRDGVKTVKNEQYDVDIVAGKYQFTR